MSLTEPSAHRPDTASAILRSVTVTAPSRLHFGLLRFGGSFSRQFGGAGLMIDAPDSAVKVVASDKLFDWHSATPRVRSVVKRWLDDRCVSEAKFTIETIRRPKSHVGLGSGTQLALSIVAALDDLHRLPVATPEQLATITGRGARSAVGTYGFCHGGFIAELGKSHADAISPLYARFAVPGSWRVVLIHPPAPPGLAGPAETAAFADLPPVPPGVAGRLERLLVDQMVPAVEHEDFATFADAVGEYGDLAGSCFSEIQHGSFASPEVGDIVRKCRELGFPGTGQSSWGPTVFTLVDTQDDAHRLQSHLRAECCSSTDVAIVGVNNEGANLRCG